MNLLKADNASKENNLSSSSNSTRASLTNLNFDFNQQQESNNLINTNTNKTVFIPYRDSILTYLLKDSLGGNSKTHMITSKIMIINDANFFVFLTSQALIFFHCHLKMRVPQAVAITRPSIHFFLRNELRRSLINPKLMR